MNGPHYRRYEATGMEVEGRLKEGQANLTCLANSFLAQLGYCLRVAEGHGAWLYLVGDIF